MRDEPAPELPAADESPAKSETETCSDAPAWRYEKIDMPPEFAPALPAGTEVLWFSPGMFEPEAADYFTYVFELHFDSTVEPSQMKSIFEEYYEGLMTAVAESRERTPRPVTVEMVDASKARIAMGDEFTTGDAIVVNAVFELVTPKGGGTCVVVRATARSGAEVEQALERARACLPCSAADGLASPG